MNCQEFKTICHELARDFLMDAAVRQNGLSHAKFCRGCAALLADERALIAGLQSLAASVLAEEAPTRLEERLRCAFHNHASVPSASGVVPLPGVSPGSSRGIIGVAVVLLLALTLIVLRFQNSASHRQLEQVQESPSAANPGIPQSSTPLASAATSGESVRARNPKDKRLTHGARHPVQHDILNTSANRSAGSPQATEPEVATDFLPLLLDGEMASLEREQIVRVLLPRSALETFGLPVNAERVSEPIQADVLMSEEGLVHAIRFVH